MELFTAWLIITFEIEIQMEEEEQRVQTEKVDSNDTFILWLYVDDTPVDVVR